MAPERVKTFIKIQMLLKLSVSTLKGDYTETG